MAASISSEVFISDILQTIDDGEGVFLFHHWLLMHTVQHREQSAFLSLCARAKQSRSIGDIERVQRAWHYIVESIRVHQALEDECFYPELEQALAGHDGELSTLEDIESQHPNVGKLLAETGDRVGALQVASGSDDDGDVVGDAIDAVVDSAREFRDAYARHSGDEENRLVPIIKRLMPLERQKQAGANVSAFMKDNPAGPFWLLQFRHVVESIPREKERFDSFFPFFLRWVLLPLWSVTNDTWKGYVDIFELQ
jgi:Hemerythrin HHE cation binding domain